MTEITVTEADRDNLALALANDPRSATLEEASAAYRRLSAMVSHRGDGIPTQYQHGAEVADLAGVMWKALLTVEQGRIEAERRALEGRDKLIEARDHYAGLYAERCGQLAREKAPLEATDADRKLLDDLNDWDMGYDGLSDDGALLLVARYRMEVERRAFERAAKVAERQRFPEGWVGNDGQVIIATAIRALSDGREG